MSKIRALLITISCGSVLLAFQNCSSSGNYSQAALASSASNSTAASTSCFLDGALVANGTVQATGYSVGQPATGAACPTSASYTCTNGVWASGLNSATVNEIFSTCSSSAACSIGGISLASGSTQVAYSATTVPYGSACTSVQATLSCTNGQLSSSTGTASNYIYTACAVAAPTTKWTYSAGDTADVAAEFGAGLLTVCPASAASGGSCTTAGAKCFASNGQTAVVYVCE